MKTQNTALQLLSLLGAIYVPAFEGDGDDTGGDDTGGDDTGGDNGGDDTGGDDTGKKQFSQADVNRLLANNKKALQATVTKLQAQQVTLQQSNTATQDEKDTLAGTISELEGQLMSQKEISDRDKKRTDKEHSEAVSKAEAERDTWRGRFESTLAVNALTQAAVEHKAFDPSQIVNMHQNAVTINEVSKDGVGTGKFEARMKLQTLNDKSESVELDLTVPEAVKELATRPTYANLFNFDGKHGLQRTNRTGIKNNLDRKEASSTMKNYRENRDSLMAE